MDIDRLHVDQTGTGPACNVAKTPANSTYGPRSAYLIAQQLGFSQHKLCPRTPSRSVAEASEFSP